MASKIYPIHIFLIILFAFLSCQTKAFSGEPSLKKCKGPEETMIKIERSVYIDGPFFIERKPPPAPSSGLKVQSSESSGSKAPKASKIAPKASKIIYNPEFLSELPTFVINFELQRQCTIATYHRDNSDTSDIDCQTIKRMRKEGHMRHRELVRLAEYYAGNPVLSAREPDPRRAKRMLKCEGY